MKVHHLDCGSMCPFGRRIVNGTGGLLARGEMPAHCLLLETDRHGLVLVDTGIGAGDLREPARLGPGFAFMMGLGAASPRLPACAQVEGMGFRREDVRHLVVTHLDLDHAGGLPDFPRAKVHVHASEKQAALARATFFDRSRYRREHLAHGPLWEPYESTGEPWRGFAAVRSLPGLPPEILAIPLPGHTRGHACIAVDAGGRWLVHAGDAYFHRATLSDSPGAAPAGLRGFERLVAFDFDQVRDNHRRLAELARTEGDVTVFSAHDPEEFRALAGAA